MKHEKLHAFLSLPEVGRPKAVMGFDGYVDTVSRLKADERSSFPDMASLGQFLAGRQERSCALTLDRRFRRFGGNMPLCANALATLGVPVSCIGALGLGMASHAFSGMHERCILHPVADPGECLVLEFSQSKLFFADHTGVGDMTWKGMTDSVGLENLRGIVADAALIGLFNWGELPNMHAVWESMLTDFMPDLPGTDRWILFDLSDCSGHSDGELRAVMSLIGGFRRHGRVVLSANDNELMALASAAGFHESGPRTAVSGSGTEGAVRDNGFISAGRAISALHIADMLVHHGISSATVFTDEGERSTEVKWVDEPSIITGGGDHFNAGFALGLLSGSDPLECAVIGNRVCHCYVRDGTSPSFERSFA
jgi:hypothetical protein